MDTADPILADLNPEQEAAVRHDDGPLLVLAGAGSGKTRVITRRIARLISGGVPPDRILAVTFTNRAAREMARRVAELTGNVESWVSTFHAFGACFLRAEIGCLGLRTDFTILDEDDSAGLVRAILDDAHIDPTPYSPARVAGFIAAAKSTGRTPDDPDPEPHEALLPSFRTIFAAYEQRIRAANAVDFEDLLGLTLRILDTEAGVRRRWQEGLDHILVDEFQDTNATQYAIVRALAGGGASVCATGDPDQAIYSWRGATVENILRFQEDFPGCTTIRLERNYRSTAAILRAASTVIARNRRRLPKTLIPTRIEGAPVRHCRYPDEHAEARAIARMIDDRIDSGARPDDIAVLFRTNALSLLIERALLEARIPYAVVAGLAFYRRRDVKDALAWVRFALNPSDTLAFARAVTSPSRGIGPRTVARLAAAAVEKGIPLGHLIADPSLRPRLSAPMSAGLASFLEGLDHIRLHDSTARAMLDAALDASGLLDAAAERVRSGEALDAVEILAALTAAAGDYDVRQDGGPQGFLEHIALISDLDADGGDGPRVSLMTAHAAKGLEFPVVILAGAEETLFPHVRALESPDGVEEERRLFHVVLTRARDEMIVTSVRDRTRRGRAEPLSPSRFLAELPDSEIEVVDESGFLGSGLDARRTVEYEFEDEDGSAFEPGDSVRHPEFGRGVVTRIRGLGSGARVVVRFDDGAERTLIPRFARLARDSGL